jgi:CheY-like chemotaxis protein
MMPDKDGIETLKEMKACTDTPNQKTPVICLTANAISGMREMYMEAGFDDYLTKPIDTGKLENMLLSYLPEDLINSPTESNQTGSSDNDKASLHTILVVNEDVKILRQIKEWLSSEYDIAVVKSSEQALAY